MVQAEVRFGEEVCQQRARIEGPVEVDVRPADELPLAAGALKQVPLDLALQPPIRDREVGQQVALELLHHVLAECDRVQ